MYQKIKSFCTGTILEIGSGVGNISNYLVRDKKKIVLSDIRANYRDIIKSKFGLDATKVIDLDIVHPAFCTVYSDYLGTFDSIFCLNVVEHVKDDRLAIENMMKLLKGGGKLTVLVPAYQALYNSFDVGLEHYRRYNKKTLLNLMAGSGTLIKAFYFNAVGILGWFVSGKLMKNKGIQQGEMKLYNYFVPIIKLVDKLLFQKIGLSVVAVIQKPQ